MTRSMKRRKQHARRNTTQYNNKRHREGPSRRTLAELPNSPSMRLIAPKRRVLSRLRACSRKAPSSTSIFVTYSTTCAAAARRQRDGRGRAGRR